MGWSPDYIEDGEDADAASMTDRFDDAKAWIDDIERDGIARGAFNHFQAHMVLTEEKQTGFTKAVDGGLHNYARAVFGTSFQYNAYGDDGGTMTSGSFTGDRIIVGHPDGTGIGTAVGNQAVLFIADGGLLVGMDNGDRCGGILVLFNVEVFDYTFGDSAGAVDIMFCVQYKLDSSATWFTVDESESFMSVNDHKIDPLDAGEDIEIDVPIVTLITEATVDENGNPATDKVQAIRVMFSVVNSQAGDVLTLSRWNLSVLPMHASQE